MYITMVGSTSPTVSGGGTKSCTDWQGTAHKKRMSKPMTKSRPTSGQSLSLSSKPRVPDRVGSSKTSRGTNKYAFSAAGPSVSEAGAKLVGKSLNSAARYSAATQVH